MSATLPGCGALAARTLTGLVGPEGLVGLVGLAASAAPFIDVSPATRQKWLPRLSLVSIGVALSSAPDAPHGDELGAVDEVADEEK